ncbi:MAG: PorV/PorQ family protein [Candidatus Marinimicrobia bacterium]|nr:PorV/PorQ family protein [Candidatus Neomarinimicrobiota bacterium]
MKRLIILLIFCTSIVFGEFDKVGTTAAQFLKIGVGARALGMGGGFVALANDGSAHYWNPAGLVLSPEISIALYHNPWILDISHDYVSLTVPGGSIGTFGLSLSTLTMDEKEVTTVKEPDGTGIYYSVMDMALGASYARHISHRLAYGITLKYIRLKAYNEQAHTFAIDVGSILKTDFYGMKLGMSLSNFGGEIQFAGRDLIEKADIDEDIDGNYLTDVNLQTEPWPLPMMIRIGIALDLLGDSEAILSNKVNRLTLAIDAIHPNDSPEHINMGLEFAFHKTLFLRSGYRFNYDEENITFGAGLRLHLKTLGSAIINYAVVPFGIFGRTSQISLELYID